MTRHAAPVLTLGLVVSLLGGCSTRNPTDVAAVRRVADRVLADFPEPPPFDWGEGVLMAGMMHAGLTLDEPRYIDFVQRWADHWEANNLPAILTDPVPNTNMWGYCGRWGPGYPVLLLYAKTRDPKYLRMARQVADFIMTKATRTSDGGLGHWGDNYQLWVDTLYMVGPPFAHLTRLTGERGYMDEAIRQIEIYSGHTQDEATGLYWHMYDEPSRQRVGVLWGRGNGWVAMTFAEVLAQLPRSDPRYQPLRARFQRQMDALLAVQDRDSNLWHTVLDDKETYLETSASAMILSAMIEAEQEGIIHFADRTAIPRTWAAVRAQVDANGRVINVSGGTMPEKPDVYAEKITGTYTWGTGAYLLAGSAILEQP